MDRKYGGDIRRAPVGEIRSTVQLLSSIHIIDKCGLFSQVPGALWFSLEAVVLTLSLSPESTALVTSS